MLFGNMLPDTLTGGGESLAFRTDSARHNNASKAVPHHLQNKLSRKIKRRKMSRIYFLRLIFLPNFERVLNGETTLRCSLLSDSIE